MKLKELRTKNKLTQQQIAKHLSMPLTTYGSYEIDKSEPSVATLVKLADLYHVTLDEIVGRPTSIINKMVLTEREQSIIDKVLKMDNKQQELTELYIDTMMGNL